MCDDVHIPGLLDGVILPIKVLQIIIIINFFFFFIQICSFDFYEKEKKEKKKKTQTICCKTTILCMQSITKEDIIETKLWHGFYSNKPSNRYDISVLACACSICSFIWLMQ
jgi:hypothetical protein